jgi:hypothetical protein
MSTPEQTSAVTQSAIQAFVGDLFRLLLRMDAEATPTAEGAPTGLHEYGRHCDPTGKKPSPETWWTRSLARLLTDAGYPAGKEQNYPDLPGCSTADRCDNVIVLPDGRRLWLEAKGAWKEYWRQQGSLGKYRLYLTGQRKSAAADVKKLLPLRPPAADLIGFLLLGFDSTNHPMLEDVAEFAAGNSLTNPLWWHASCHWPDRYRSGRRVHAWVWIRITT